MKAAPQRYIDRITDGETQQECLLINGSLSQYPTGLFSALDGDFTSDGVTIEQTECESDDLRFGSCGSAQISFSLINERGWMLADFPWGEMTCYIGVKIFDDEELTNPNNNFTAFARGYGADDYYYARRNAIWRYDGSTHRQSNIYNGASGVVFTGFLVHGNYMIAIGEGACVKYDASTDTATEITPNRHLANKLMKGTSYTIATHNSTGGIVYYTRCSRLENGNYLREVYMMSSMGRFIIERPDNMQSDVVEINDAHDILGALDIDATEFIGGLTYPTTMKAIAEAAIALVDANASIKNPYIDEYTASIAESPFGSGSYTVRDILSSIAEALGSNIIVETRNGVNNDSTVLRFALACNPPGDYVETIDWSRIASGTLKIKSFRIPQIKTLRLKKQDGSVVELNVGSLVATNTYEISNNPFVQSLPYDGVLQSRFPHQPVNNPWQYYPASLSVIYANPLVELGDTIQVESAEEQYTPQYDVYGRETGLNEYHAPIYIPLMHRTLHWQGFCFADYEATGNAIRYAEKSMQTYQNNVAMDYADSLEVQLNAKINNITVNLGKRENVDDTTGVDVSSEVTTNINSLTLETGHKYIILAHVDFPSNATGRRGIFVSNTSGSATPLTNGSRVIQNAVDGAATRMQCVFIVNLTSTSVLYLNVFQNSGSVLRCASYMDAIRII